MGWSALCEDMKRDILKRTLEDTRGNITVPGLVLGTRLRAVSKDVAAQFAAVETPYDGQVSFEGSWPAFFVGGLGMFDFQKMKTHGQQDKAPGFFVVRDAKSGFVFACTVTRAPVGGGECHIHRLWPLWRLAELLNGHCADYVKQLPDLHRVATWDNSAHVDSFRVLRGPGSKYTGSVRTHNQIETLEPNGLDAPVETHANDFVSHQVHYTAPPTCKPRWCKTSSLVFATQVDNRYTQMHISEADVHNRVFEKWPGVHTIAVALGWYDLGSTMHATGWMISLYCHGRKGVPTSYDEELTPKQLKRMGYIALCRFEKRERVKAKSAQPTEAPTRRPRGAALKAKRKMNDQLLCDSYQDSKGRMQSWMQPSDSRALQENEGLGDDQYAKTGAMDVSDVDSDVEYGDEPPTRRQRAAQRVKNLGAAWATALKEYAEMLEPSDDESE